MERTKEEIKKVRIDFSQLKQADSIEEILCLATLIATKEFNDRCNVQDAKMFYKILEGCENCKHNKLCLACIINE